MVKDEDFVKSAESFQAGKVGVQRDPSMRMIVDRNKLIDINPRIFEDVAGSGNVQDILILAMIHYLLLYHRHIFPPLLAILLIYPRFCVRRNVKIIALQTLESSITLGSKHRSEQHHTSTLGPIESEDVYESLWRHALQLDLKVLAVLLLEISLCPDAF
ncbi:hypothetical protein ARMGADRAFT_1037833 [Armillaria gallica]|uniref:Uncharacterized protein n=1 Tax=Armillaria gallica TaxID=47427 RepID=A0A2H3D540_ARMGA|nr:hypothetical protein ARMGADRAFT_1037833 [Armillaria gallica]